MTPLIIRPSGCTVNLVVKFNAVVTAELGRRLEAVWDDADLAKCDAEVVRVVVTVLSRSLLPELYGEPAAGPNGAECTALPGSVNRVETMKSRRKARVKLYHPKDRNGLPYDDPGVIALVDGKPHLDAPRRQDNRPKKLPRARVEEDGASEDPTSRPRQLWLADPPWVQPDPRKAIWNPEYYVGEGLKAGGFGCRLSSDLPPPPAPG